MKCFDPEEPFHHISPPVCQAVQMGAHGVISKLDADIYILDEALKVVFLSHTLALAALQ